MNIENQTGREPTGQEAGATGDEELFGGSPQRTGESPVPPRLSVQTVERLHRLLGGDAHVEDMVLRFIEARYGAKNLLWLPPHVAREIVKRPADFITAVKNHCEPELRF